MAGGATVDAGLNGRYQAPEDPLTGAVARPGGIEGQVGAEQDLVVAGVIEAEPAVRAAAGPQPLDGAEGVGHRARQGLIEAVETVSDHGLDQLIPVGEMPVDGGRGDPGLAGHRGQREHLRIAGGLKEPGSCLDQFHAQAGTLSPAVFPSPARDQRPARR